VPVEKNLYIHEPMCPSTNLSIQLSTFNHLFLPFGSESFVFSRLSRNVKVKIYKTIILPVVLYGCETWSLTLMEEHRLSVFENRVLRRIFGPKRDEVTGE
jgi:hypothetical protein